MSKYEQDFCDREYNARLAVPTFAQYFARWAERSATVRAQLPVHRELAYGEDPSERMDLFPSTGESRALLLFIHGGYWRSLDKADFSFVAPPLVNAGVSVAVVNYALCPAVSIDHIVLQMVRACAWLYCNADRYGADPERLFAAGHSAGAHLATMLLAAQWPRYDQDLPPKLVKGALGMSGLYDLEPLSYAPFVNADLKLDAAAVRKLSPAWMPPATNAGLYLAVGGAESSEFRRQAELLGKCWRANLAEQLILPDVHHFSIVDEFARPNGPLFDATMRMLQG